LNDRNQRVAAIGFDLLAPSEPRILQVTTPVFREYPSGTLESIGSAILLRVGDEALVLSAAHVLDHATETSPLYIGSHDSGVLLQGRWFRTPLPESGQREDDRVDVGCARLLAKAVDSFDHTCFLASAELAPHRILSPGDHVVLSGYPCTKQRWAGKLEREASLYAVIAECSPVEDYGTLGVDRSHAVVLGFDKRRVRTRHGPATAPDLWGVSGGGLWILRRPGPEQPPAPLLAGIAIEWHKTRRKRVVATRIEVLLYGIWGHWPELRPFLPWGPAERAT